jgi:processive 1,2-diacylglycerol beta-glucosyltransferase
MKSKNVSILYLSIGSGHQVAAEALATEMRHRNPGIKVCVEDPFSAAIKFLPSMLTTLQAATNILVPDIYDASWRRGTIKDTPIENSRMLQDFLLARLNSCDSGIIVTTALLPCLLVSKLKQSKQLDDSKLFSVITDFGANPMWPIDDVDGYFVPHAELRRTLVYRGVDPGIIHITGIPIRSTPDRPRRMSQPNRLRVLMIAGGIRNGGYANITNQVTQILQLLEYPDPSRLEISIVTGNQPHLECELRQIALKSRYHLEIHGFVNDMQGLMKAHDILIAKPGGLVIAEALSSGIPFIPSRPTPGVEVANLEFLIRHGIAMRGGSTDEIIKSLRFCLENPEPLEQMKLRAGQLGHPHSSTDVTRHILGQFFEDAAIEVNQPISIG